MTSPYADLDRPPLRAAALRRALVGDVWTDLRVVASTGSTNTDVLATRSPGTVIVAEAQTAGKGRLGRRWSMPARSGLAFSALLRPDAVPPARFGWIPLLAGVALVTAVRRVADVDAVLKWPNDLLIDDRKCGGILVEAFDGFVAIGIGLNTSVRAAELPVPTATSLALAGAASYDRDPLLRSILRTLADLYSRWVSAGGDDDALRESYLLHCGTLGREVRVELPDGTSVNGRADTIDPGGRLVVDGRAFAAGDVIHLR